MESGRPEVLQREPVRPVVSIKPWSVRTLRNVIRQFINLISRLGEVSMNDYYVVYIKTNEISVEYGSCFIHSDKTGKDLVRHLIDQLHKLVDGAIMMNFIKL